MRLTTSFIFLCLLALAASATQEKSLCASVSAHAFEEGNEWPDIPAAIRSPWEWDGSQVEPTVLQLSPSLHFVEAMAILTNMHRQGHRILFVPELGDAGKVLLPGHPFIKFLEASGYTPPASGHWVLVGKNCDYFTLFHESIHLSDLPMVEVVAVEIEKVLKGGSSGASEVYLESVGNAFLVLIFEQRALTLEMQEVRARVTDKDDFRRRELLAHLLMHQHAKPAAAKLDFLKNDSTAIYDGIRALLRRHALPGEFAPEDFFPDHF